MRQARRRHRLRLDVVAIVIALLGGSAQRARPQRGDSSVTTAQAVGTAFLRAVQMSDWKAAASFLDIVPFDHYRLAQIDAARRMRKRSPITAEQLMKMDSLMPRAVAEYEIKRMGEHTNTSFLQYEFGISDPDSLAALSASVVAQRWLEIHDPRWRFHAAIDKGSCPPTVLEHLPTPKFQVFGTVVNGNLAYLLYDRDDDPMIGVDEVRSSGPRMLTLRRDIDTWWVLPRLDRSAFNMASMVDCSKAK